jgi:hypothetical protein
MRLILLLSLLLPQVALAQSISDFDHISHWSCDEASGVRYDSNASSSNDLSDFNSVGNLTGALNSGCDFEESNSEYLAIADGSQNGLDGFTNDFTVSMWLKPETLPSSGNEAQLTTKFEAAGADSDDSWEVYLRNHSGTQQIRVLFNDESNGTTWGAHNHTLSTSDWTHVVAVVDTDVPYIDVIINNSSSTLSLSASSGDEGNVNDGGADFSIGALEHATLGYMRYYDGGIDEITFFQGKLTSDEVSTLYNSGTPLPYQSTATPSTTNPIIVINNSMPKLETVVANGATYTLNYATATEVYITPQTLSIVFFTGLAFALVMGFLAYRFL